MPETKEEKQKRLGRNGAQETSWFDWLKSDKQARREEPKGPLREWVDSVVFAVIVVVIVRAFFFDMFRIPTPSMEKTLMVGDYLFVSKLHYGYRTPIGVCVPFTNWCVPGVRLPHTRLPGFDDLDRGDAIVFNYPADNGPINQKLHYIKRVMGMPGDTLAVRDKTVYIDGQPQQLMPTMEQQWNVYKEDPRVRLSATRLSDVGVDSAWATSNPSVVQMTATKQSAQALERWSYVERVEPYVTNGTPGYQLYPPGRGYTRDNYGPLPIPKKGQQVTLTAQNADAYLPVIRRYERHRVRQVAKGVFTIDGQRTNTYTFKQDYFFAMGDNRDSSEDSRFWGYVPMDHVVGRAVMIYFSWDAEAMMPRFSRIFSLIK